MEQTGWATSPVLHGHNHLSPTFSAISGLNICLLTIFQGKPCILFPYFQTPYTYQVPSPPEERCVLTGEAVGGTGRVQDHLACSIPCVPQVRGSSATATCPQHISNVHGSRPDTSDTVSNRGVGSGSTFSHLCALKSINPSDREKPSPGTTQGKPSGG